MKILHVIPYFAPAWAYGGTPRAVYEIAKVQVALGNEVTVLTTDAFEKDRLFQNQEDIEGIHVVRLPTISNWITWQYHFAIPRKLPSKLQDEEFDIAHLHEVRTPINLIALQFISAKCFLLHPWGTLPENNRFIAIKKLIDSIFLHTLKEKISISFGQTSHEVDVLKRFGLGKKILLIPLGININEFTDLPEKQFAKKQLNIKLKNFEFIYLGRLSPVKGIDILLRSLEKIIAINRSVHLTIVGRNDGYLRQLNDIIARLGLSNHVAITKPLYETDRLLAYRAADCFVSTPTVYEETSTTCLEALACGTPVITTHQSEVPKLTSADGVIHTESTAEAVYKAMLEMIAKPPRVDLSKIKRNFDWEKIVVSMMNQI